MSNSTTILTNTDLMARVPLFSDLSASQLESLSKNVTKRRYKRGQAIVVQGEKSNALFILLGGRANVVVLDSHGKEAIITALTMGDYLGEMSLIDNQPHSASVVAETVTDTLVLNRAELIHCMTQNIQVAFSMMRGLVQRLRSADQKIESLALMDVYGRVARALLDMVVQGSDGRKLIPGKLSKQNLAKMVGASREMVSRVMKDLERSGSLSVTDDGTFQVHDRIAGLL